MGSQVFKHVPDHKVLFSLLDDVCSRNEKYFVITEINYKQLLYGDRIQNFYDYLRPFYFNSKQIYFENSRTYSGFLTIVRQLSKLYSIPYTSKTVYGQGSYTRTLCLIIDRNNWKNLPPPENTNIPNARFK